MEHCPAGKTTPQSWGTFSEQKEASFQKFHIHKILKQVEVSPPELLLCEVNNIIFEYVCKYAHIVRTLDDSNCAHDF